MKRQITTYALLAAALLLAGCSKEPIDSPGAPSQGVALDFSVEGLGETLSPTKAALASGTTVRVIAYKSNSANPATANYVADQAYYWNGSKLVPCTVDANGKKTADAPTQVMKLLPAGYDFYAVSPALPLAANKTTLATAVPQGMDFASSAKKTITVPTQAAPLTLTLNQLTRRCSQVVFVVKNNDTYAGPRTMTVKSLQVTGLPNSAANVPVSGTFQATSMTSAAQTFSNFTKSGTTSTLNAPLICPPKSNFNLTVSVTVEADGVTATYSNTMSAATFTSGKKHNVIIEVSEKTGIAVTAASWSTTNGAATPEMNTYPRLEGTNTVVIADRYGSKYEDIYPYIHSKTMWFPTSNPNTNWYGWRIEVSNLIIFNESSSLETKCQGYNRLTTWNELNTILEYDYFLEQLQDSGVTYVITNTNWKVPDKNSGDNRYPVVKASSPINWTWTNGYRPWNESHDYLPGESGTFESGYKELGTNGVNLWKHMLFYSSHYGCFCVRDLPST